MQLTNTGFLSLAEVQVFGSGSQANLALGKAASQSSTYPGFAGTGAASAVDGTPMEISWTAPAVRRA